MIQLVRQNILEINAHVFKNYKFVRPKKYYYLRSGVPSGEVGVPQGGVGKSEISSKV